MESHDEGQRDELEKLMQEGKRKGEEIADRSRGLTQYGQRIIDLANAGINVLKYPAPSGVNWQPMIEPWRYQIEQQEQILGGLQTIPIQQIVVSGTATNYAMTILSDGDYVANLSPKTK